MLVFASTGSSSLKRLVTRTVQQYQARIVAAKHRLWSRMCPSTNAKSAETVSYQRNNHLTRYQRGSHKAVAEISQSYFTSDPEPLNRDNGKYRIVNYVDKRSKADFRFVKLNFAYTYTSSLRQVVLYVSILSSV